MARRWTTPDGLAFEGLQTGDGRIFVAGCFGWDGDSWPLRYDREDDGAHLGAVMVGAIDSLSRAEIEGQADQRAIRGEGDLDNETDMGGEVERMLDNGAPLGISVDMDDIEVEWVVSADDVEQEEVVIFAASFAHGAMTRRRMSVAAGSSETRLVWQVWAPGIGRLHRQVYEDLGAPLTAAAGEGDFGEDDSIVLFADSMDEVLMRFTRARIRGATLVDIPAFDRAAIQLEPVETEGGDGTSEGDGLAALLAAAIGAADLPLASRDRSWDGSGAHQRQSGSGDDVDKATMRRGHFYRDDDADPDTAGAYKLPFADVIDGTLTAVPAGIFAVAGVLQGARGGANIPQSDQDAIKSKVSAYYGRMRKEFDDDSIVAPWDDKAAAGGCDDCTGAARAFAAASALVAAADAPMRPPADWFEPPQWRPDEVVTVTDPKTGRQLAGVPMRYEEHGEVVGHIALWGQCHTGSPDGQCVLTPHSNLDYVPFHHGSVKVEDGRVLAVGNLTMGGGHADGRLSYAGAIEHYDDAGRLVAQVRAGEDEYGVWVHGAGMPDVWADELELRRLGATSPSGDWRTVGGHLELTAALAVNHPGFPVPRAQVASGGAVVSLVAAGSREAVLLAKAAAGPQGQRLAEIVQQAVQAGIDGYLRQQEAAARSAAARRSAAETLDGLRRERAKRILQGAMP